MKRFVSFDVLQGFWGSALGFSRDLHGIIGILLYVLQGAFCDSGVIFQMPESSFLHRLNVSRDCLVEDSLLICFRPALMFFFGLFA